MIYIFDDRFERREAFCPIINKYPKYISFANIECATKEEFESFIAKSLNNPTLLLLHSSYRYIGNELNNDEVLKTLCSLGGAIVQFSGAYHHPNIRLLGKHRIYEVNSITMYNNLELYVKYLIANQNSPIEILLWGKDFLMSQIITAQSEIVRSLCKTKISSNANVEIIEKIKAIVQNRLRSEDLQSLCKNINSLLDNTTPNKNIGLLLQEIQKEFAHYNIL